MPLARTSTILVPLQTRDSGIGEPCRDRESIFSSATCLQVGTGFGRLLSKYIGEGDEDQTPECGVQRRQASHLILVSAELKILSYPLLRNSFKLAFQSPSDYRHVI